MMRAVVLLLCLTALVHAEGKGRYNEQKSSNMDVKGSDTLGEEMFQVEKEDDSSNSSNQVSFGMFKIIELDADNNTLNSTGHKCNFRKMNITCSKGSTVAFVQDGLDDDGNSSDITSMRVTRRCDLSACNNGTNSENATLVLFTDIFDVKNGSYICQPNCTTNANSTFQSPVSNGTVKWAVRMENWGFCNTGGSCGDKAGSQLKIVFKVMGKKKGDKDFKEAKKKIKDAVDSVKQDKKCEIVRKSMDNNRSNKTRDMSDKKNWKESSQNWTNKKENQWKNINEDDDTDDDKDGGNKGGGNKDGSNKRDKRETVSMNKGDKTGDRNSTAGDKSGWGRCRNARGWGPGGKPDDQENYNFGGDNAGAVFRMMGMAVLDNDTVADNNINGFFGPGEHKENDTDGKSIPGLVYIIVPRFNVSMEYDPTVDIEESGGAGTAESGSSSVVPFLSIISLLLAYLLA